MPCSGGEALARLRRVGEAPRAEARALKDRTGAPLVGYFDAYLPEEMVMAHGALPFRVTVDGRDTVRSPEFIQGYACPAARDLLDQGLRGDLDFLDGALFTRYCDSLRGVFAVWDAEGLSRFAELVRYPTVTDTQAAVDYLAAELREVSARMGEALSIPPVDDRRLVEAIDACNRKRGLVQELAARRMNGGLKVSGADYLAILNAATVMLPDAFTALLSAVMEKSSAGPPEQAGLSGVPIILSGVTFDNIELARLLEGTGLDIRGDDLSTGSRWYGVHVRAGMSGGHKDADPWVELARAYLTKPPCSVKEPSSPRADHLVEQVGKAGAAGVVFYRSKFCDSEQVEWPHVRDRLEKEGIPVTLVEGEHRATGFEQARTRLEAFRERLEDEGAFGDGEDNGV